MPRQAGCGSSSRHTRRERASSRSCHVGLLRLFAAAFLAQDASSSGSQERASGGCERVESQLFLMPETSAGPSNRPHIESCSFRTIPCPSIFIKAIYFPTAKEMVMTKFSPFIVLSACLILLTLPASAAAEPDRGDRVCIYKHDNFHVHEQCYR